MLQPMNYEPSRFRSRMALALLLAACACAAMAADAGARTVYVTDFGFAAVPGSLWTIDNHTNSVAGSPLELSKKPGAIAIAPDGKTAYLVNPETDDVSILDTRTNRVVGSPIHVGDSPERIAIAPDGKLACVTNFTSNNVSVIDLQTDSPVGSPIQVGKGPEGIAIAPDGKLAYVANAEGKSVSVVDLGTNQATATVPVGERPKGIAVTPDGKRVYVANAGSNNVSVIDTRTDQEVPGSPITVGESPDSVAVAPNGKAVYVSNFSSDNVSVIDTETNLAATTIQVGEEPLGIAISPDGKAAYVPSLVSGTVSVIDAIANEPLGTPIRVGVQPEQVAIVPDQAPVASFSHPVARPGVPVAFDASASHDSDGSVADFAWGFGDGAGAPNGGSAPSHAFAHPGTYKVTLTATDNEGCSTALVFTGQTASCNGSASATETLDIDVVYPAVRVSCPARARPRSCLFRLRAVTRQRRGKAETGVARVKVRAGKSAIVSLKPSARFARRLATAKKVLVERTLRIGASRQTTFRQLKIVR